MAASEQMVHVNSGRPVAKIVADPSLITGEAGPLRPTLIVPITLSMRSHPAAANGMHLTIPRLRAWLCADANAFPQTALCAPVDENFIDNMPLLSQAQEPTYGHRVNLRFRLTLPELANLEARRHARPQHEELVWYLRVEPEVAGLHTFGNGANSESPWADMGFHSVMAHFWKVDVSPLHLQIPRETWVTKVLPGLGYDQVRLVEVRLPPSLPEHPTAGSLFDTARRALDERRYDDCVIACRGLVNLWNVKLGATRAEPLAQLIGKARQWKDDDPRINFIDATWKGLIDIVNEQHHPEGQRTQLSFDPATARLVFNMVMTFSEYVGAQ